MTTRTNRKQQGGFSMVELMVAGTVGLIIIGGAIGIFANTAASNTNVLKTTRLEEELASIMTLMVRDLRRAGFTPSAHAPTNIGVGYTNPFTTITIADVDGDTTPDDFDCILYTYDGDDGDGALDTPAEEYGFRLNGGTVEMRQAGNGCSDSNWQDLGDPSVVTVTDLTFTEDITNITVSTGGTVAVRRLTIELSGELANDASVAREYTQTIRVRNDQVS